MSLFGLFGKKEKEKPKKEEKQDIKSISEVKPIEKEKEVIQKPKNELKKLFSKEELYKINSNIGKPDCDYYYDALQKVLPEYKIDTPLRICHFLAQILHESGHLKYKCENLNYSAESLRKVFPKYFKTAEIAQQYARKPEKIANRVYANRMGNGNEASGDGWKYRGRGILELTGYINYKTCGQDLGIDLENNPSSIIIDPVLDVKIACWFWNKNKLNELADKDDIISITKKINGGLNGISDRCKILNLAKNVIKT